MSTETWITTVTDHHGKRSAKRHALQVPLDLATGRLERLSNLALRETIKDLLAEQERRDGNEPPPEVPDEPAPQAVKQYDPFASQMKGTS